MNDHDIEHLMTTRLGRAGIDMRSLEPIAPAIAALLQAVASIGTAVADVPRGRDALAIVLATCSDALDAEAGRTVICGVCMRSIVPMSADDLPADIPSGMRSEILASVGAGMLPAHSGYDARFCAGSGHEPLAVAV